MKPNSIVNDIFDGVKGQLGFVPNLYKEMSQSPAVLEVYHKGQEALSRGAYGQGTTSCSAYHCSL